MDAFGPIKAAPFFRRVKGLLTTRCPDHDVTITMQWSEAVRRLRQAAELRASVGRMRQAMRRAMGGDRVGTIRALRGRLTFRGTPSVRAGGAAMAYRRAEAEARAENAQFAQLVSQSSRATRTPATGVVRDAPFWYRRHAGQTGSGVSSGKSSPSATFPKVANATLRAILNGRPLGPNVVRQVFRTGFWKASWALPVVGGFCRRVCPGRRCMFSCLNRSCPGSFSMVCLRLGTTTPIAAFRRKN